MTAAAAFRVREFIDADTDPLLDLFRDSVRNIARKDYSEEQVHAWAPDDLDRQSWASKCASRQTFVAELDGALAGFGDLEADGHVDMMFVHSRFQRRGVASLLLAQIESKRATPAYLAALHGSEHHRETILRTPRLPVDCASGGPQAWSRIH